VKNIKAKKGEKTASTPKIRQGDRVAQRKKVGKRKGNVYSTEKIRIKRKREKGRASNMAGGRTSTGAGKNQKTKGGAEFLVDMKENLVVGTYTGH